MKLAEALLLRSDMQKKVESLRERIAKNALVQEGEQPSEDPAALLKQAVSICGDLKKRPPAPWASIDSSQSSLAC